MKEQELIRLLITNGWTLIRVKGSYQEYKHPFTDQTITVDIKVV